MDDNNIMNETGGENENVVQSASLHKLGKKEERDTDSCVTQQWLILHVSRLIELIGGLICPNCARTRLQVTIDPINQGFCSALDLKCTMCTS